MKTTSIQIIIRAPRPNRRWFAVPAALLALLLALSGGAYASASTGPHDHIAQLDPSKETDPEGGQVYEDVPPANTFYEFINRITLQGLVGGYPCGGAGEPCVPPENRPYYRPGNSVTRAQMAKFVDQARRQPGISLDTATEDFPLFSRTTVANDGTAVYGWADCSSCEGAYGTSASGIGVWGRSTSGTGVWGVANGSYAKAVHGSSTAGYGGYFESDSGLAVEVRGGSGLRSEGTEADSWGVLGIAHNGSNAKGVWGSSTNGIGVFGISSGGRAGYFQGNVQVTGNLSKGGGSFKIDHPLDPENKYLYHSFVESPDMLNIYRGHVTLDAGGESSVELPEWFEALNRDFDYQLTAIGAPMPNLYIADKIKDNRFKIGGGKAGMEVSWQVTGIRKDAYAEAHRIPVEEIKPASEQGKYLHPTEHGQPESKGVGYEHSRQMQQENNP